MLRRCLIRWMNLALILVLRFLFLISQSNPQVLRSISSAVKQRFPTLDHVVDTGFMTKNEKKLFEAVPANEFNTYWVPAPGSYSGSSSLAKCKYSTPFAFPGCKKQRRRENC